MQSVRASSGPHSIHGNRVYGAGVTKTTAPVWDRMSIASLTCLRYQRSQAGSQMPCHSPLSSRSRGGGPPYSMKTTSGRNLYTSSMKYVGHCRHSSRSLTIGPSLRDLLESLESGHANIARFVATMLSELDCFTMLSPRF